MDHNECIDDFGRGFHTVLLDSLARAIDRRPDEYDQFWCPKSTPFPQSTVAGDANEVSVTREKHMETLAMIKPAPMGDFHIP